MTALGIDLKEFPLPVGTALTRIPAILPAHEAGHDPRIAEEPWKRKVAWSSYPSERSVPWAGATSRKSPKLLSAKRSAYFCKSIAIEMGGASRYFSNVLGSGVDSTLLKKLQNDFRVRVISSCTLRSPRNCLWVKTTGTNYFACFTRQVIWTKARKH